MAPEHHNTQRCGLIPQKTRRPIPEKQETLIPCPVASLLTPLTQLKMQEPSTNHSQPTYPPLLLPPTQTRHSPLLSLTEGAHPPPLPANRSFLLLLLSASLSEILQSGPNRTRQEPTREVLFENRKNAEILISALLTLHFRFNPPFTISSRQPP